MTAAGQVEVKCLTQERGPDMWLLIGIIIHIIFDHRCNLHVRMVQDVCVYPCMRAFQGELSWFCLQKYKRSVQTSEMKWVKCSSMTELVEAHL